MGRVCVIGGKGGIVWQLRAQPNVGDTLQMHRWRGNTWDAVLTLRVLVRDTMVSTFSFCSCCGERFGKASAAAAVQAGRAMGMRGREEGGRVHR
jgi:hypothetical protein